jgi:hypothetical protein
VIVEIKILESNISDKLRLLALAENRPQGRNRRDQPYEGEGSADRLSFLCAELISEEEGDPRAKKSTRDDNKREFWATELDFLHK